MKTTALIALLVSLSSLTPATADIISFGSGANTFDMEFVSIGNPGNPADTTGSPNPAGSVAYYYRMGKFEVSREMVTKASTAGNLGISLADMSSFGANGVNRPATGVTWNEAARFVNWLNTSQGFTPAYKFTSEPDGTPETANQDIALWVAGDAGFNAANPFRNTRAQYFLPSGDEWYKAAYYNPTSGVYVDYPTGSDNPPASVASGTAANTAVYGRTASTGPADITLAGGLSFYGTMGQGGNASEWEETEFDLLNDSSSSERGIRGGYFRSGGDVLLSSSRSVTSPTSGNISTGFRVASKRMPPGDYNRNGTVDAADYNVWRDNIGEIVSPGTGADFNQNGFVENSEYFPWRDHFGESNIDGASGTQFARNVPEPSTVGLLLVLIVSLGCTRFSSTVK